MEEQNSNDLKRIFNIVELYSLEYLLRSYPRSIILEDRPREHFPTANGYRVFKSQFANKIAGRIDKLGYLRIKINNKMFAGHRIIWKMYYGEDPKYFIDHINGIKNDNRIENLRDIERGYNTINLNSLKNNNKTGFTGVSKLKSGKYRSYITIEQKQTTLGHYDTVEEAALVRELKFIELYGEEFYYANEKNKIILEELKLKVKGIDDGK